MSETVSRNVGRVAMAAFAPKYDSSFYILNSFLILISVFDIPSEHPLRRTKNHKKGLVMIVDGSTKRVLVTGANGFIGSNLVEALLERGYEVTCLVREKARIERLKKIGAEIEICRGLDDREALRRAVAGKDAVFHVAGALRALKTSWFFHVNEEGTRNMAAACAEQPRPPVFVFVSSLAATGPAVEGISGEGRPRRETDPPRPISNYGRSKLAGETAIRRFAESVPISIVRPAIVLGPADRAGLGMFKPVARFRFHAMPGNGRQRMSIIHVADLAELLILAAERGRRITADASHPLSAARGCYFAACDEYPTYAELGTILRDAVGRRVVIRFPMHMSAIWAIAASTEAVSRVVRRPFYLNIDKAREIAAGSWICSPQTAIEELGFAPKFSLNDRIKQTAAWYRRAGWL